MALMMKSSVSVGVAARPVRRAAVKVAAAKEGWYPGASVPAYLDVLPASYGFDPLHLGGNPETLKYYAEGEVTNGRWAMAAVAGILATDLAGLPKFWQAGSETYWLDNQTLAAVEIAVFAVLEGLRYNNFKKTGSLTTFIDPLNMKSEQTTIKEIKNGRLAMLAFIGFVSQAAVTGKGPIECLTDHIADPQHNNIFTSSVGKETAVAVAVLSVWPMIIEATKTSGKSATPSLFPWAAPWEQK